MKSTLRLKQPFFITFKDGDIEREEAIRYLTFQHFPGAGDPLPGYQDVEDMMSRLDLESHGYTDDEVRDMLARSDIDLAIREAHLDAEYRALDYLWAVPRRDQSKPCPVRVLTREERRERAYGMARELLASIANEATHEGVEA